MSPKERLEKVLELLAPLAGPGKGRITLTWVATEGEDIPVLDAIAEKGRVTVTRYDHEGQPPYVIESVKANIGDIYVTAQTSRPADAGEGYGADVHVYDEHFVCREVSRCTQGK